MPLNAEAFCFAGNENDVVCVGAYPNGSDYDMNYGRPGERPLTDGHIRKVPLPETDPVYGRRHGLPEIWRQRVNAGVCTYRK